MEQYKIGKNENILNNSKRPELSIIIVNWNTKDLLLKCINSLNNSEIDIKMEIIVVDNGSTDGSQEHLKKYNQNVKLLQNKKNLGFAKANNIGIRESCGKYLCFVNSDVIVKKNCLRTLKEYMSRNKDVGLIGPKIFLPSGHIQVSCRRFPSLWRKFTRAICLNKIFKRSRIFAGHEDNYISYDKISEVDVLIGACWFTKREAIRNVGLLDENFFIYGEDRDWCRRFRENNWKIIYYPHAEIIHYTGASSASAPLKFYAQLCKADLKYWEKYGTRVEYYCAVFLLAIHNIIRIFLHTIYIARIKSNKEVIIYKIKRSFVCLKMLVELMGFYRQKII